jgi:hypothetical protein
MDGCIAVSGCTYIGGGGPPRGGAQEAPEGGGAPGSPPPPPNPNPTRGAQAPNTSGHAGPTWGSCIQAAKYNSNNYDVFQ